MSVRIFHNPRCSKSRQTLQLLRDKKIDVDVLRYLETPPSAEELGHVLALLDMEPRDLMRKQEAAYIEHGLDAPDLSRERLIEAMVQNPILIERPIVISDGKAAIGRPPENVLRIL